jgi:hypothetical protein
MIKTTDKMVAKVNTSIPAIKLSFNNDFEQTNRKIVNPKNVIAYRTDRIPRRNGERVLL